MLRIALSYHFPWLNIEMLNYGARKTKSKFLFFIFIVIRELKVN